MKQITLELTGYGYYGEIYGRTWQGLLCTYPVSKKIETLQEIDDIKLESLETGDFEYLIGACLEINEVYDYTYEKYIETKIIGEFPCFCKREEK